MAITYKTILAEAIRGYNDIQTAINQNGAPKYIKRNTTVIGTDKVPGVSRDSNGVVSGLLTSGELASAIRNMAVIDGGNAGYITGEITYHPATTVTAELTGTTEVSFTYTIPKGYHTGSGTVTGSLPIGSASGLNVTSVSGSTEVTVGTVSSGYYPLTANNLSIKAKHTGAGYTTTSTEYTDTDVDGASIGKIKAASVTTALNNAGSTLSTSNLTTEGTNNSGISLKALAPTGATVSISAGYIEGKSYNVSGTDSSEVYLKAITIDSGKTFASITNKGTITTLNNTGASSTSKASLTIVGNTNGVVTFKKDSSATSNFTKIVDNVTYVGGTASANGTAVTDSDNKLITATAGDVTITANQTISITETISLVTTDDTNVTSKNISGVIGGTAYTTESAVKNANYDYFVAVNSKPTGGTKTITADASIKKTGWATTSMDFTAKSSTVTASGNGSTVYFGVTKAVPSNSLATGDNISNYTNGNIVLSATDKKLYIKAGYIPNTYFDLGTLIPDISSGDASASHILLNQKAYDEAGNLLTGSMPNNGEITETLTTQGEEYTIPAGYHNGSGRVTLNMGAATLSNVTTSDKGVIITSSAGYIPSGTKISSINIPALEESLGSPSGIFEINIEELSSNTSAMALLRNGGNRHLLIDNSGTLEISGSGTSYHSVSGNLYLMHPSFEGDFCQIVNNGNFITTSRTAGTGNVTLSKGSGKVEGSNVTLSTTNSSGISVSGSGTVSGYGSGTVSTGTGWVEEGSTTSNNSTTKSETSNAQTKYISALTLASGKTLSSITNNGTITSLIGSGRIGSIGNDKNTSTINISNIYSDSELNISGPINPDQVKVVGTYEGVKTYITGIAVTDNEGALTRSNITNKLNNTTNNKHRTEFNSTDGTVYSSSDKTVQVGVGWVSSAGTYTIGVDNTGSDVDNFLAEAYKRLLGKNYADFGDGDTITTTVPSSN